MTTYIIIGVVVLLLLLLFFTGYLKAPPDTAYIISGLGRKRILIGKAGWRVPFFERVDKLSLRVMQVDVRTSEAVPTNEFINVTVDGVANVKISSDPELLKLAAEALLGKRPEELIGLVTQVLEGNMREIVGSVGLKEMVQDRQGVARKITENVVPDMRKLGLEVVNFNIQNFKDGAGTIENMGIDNVEQIRKNAQIAKANAQRDIAIATSNAQQEANAVKVQAEKMIAEQDAALAIQQAEMKVKADTKKAEADALRFAMEQEAEGIRAKGLAEAEAIEKKAEAQRKMGEASVLEMYLSALPEVVKNAAAPLAQTDKIVMYGDGNSTKLVKDVMSSASQIMDGVKESTGLDITALLSGVVGGSMAASRPVTVEVKAAGDGKDGADDPAQAASTQEGEQQV